MSREIKFRAWDKTNKKMYGVGMIDCYGNGISVVSKFKEKLLIENFGSKDIELMQYTGLKDKNEKEIYDGDILFESFGERYYKVVFENGSYRAEFEEYSLDLIDVAHCCEIVGNIFENSELHEQLGY